MVICADTSALFSLYAHDAHSSRIVAWLTTQRRPLVVTLLHEFELSNVLRFAEWRGAIGTGQAEDEGLGVAWRRPFGHSACGSDAAARRTCRRCDEFSGHVAAAATISP